MCTFTYILAPASPSRTAAARKTSGIRVRVVAGLNKTCVYIYFTFTVSVCVSVCLNVCAKRGEKRWQESINTTFIITDLNTVEGVYILGSTHTHSHTLMHVQRERPSYTDPDTVTKRGKREKKNQAVRETLESVYLHNLFFVKSLGEE